MDPTDSFVMPNPPLADAKAYLDRVMKETGQNLTAIARRSKVDPATLTRPYNTKGWKLKISLAVLRKVAKATKVPMPAQMDPNPPENGVADEADLLLEMADQLPGELSPEEKRAAIRRLAAVLRRRGLIGS